MQISVKTLTGNIIALADLCQDAHPARQSPMQISIKILSGNITAMQIFLRALALEYCVIFVEKWRLS